MRTIEYNGCDIRIIDDNATYINAPDLSRVYQEAKHLSWLNEPETKEFIKLLETELGIPAKEAVKLEGIGLGTIKATYMVAPLALEYVRSYSLPLYLQLLQTLQQVKQKEQNDDEIIKTAFNILQNRNKEQSTTIKEQTMQLKRLQETKQQILNLLTN